MPRRVESPMVRQWTLLRALSARRHGCTVKELADELEVAEKTVRRDLVALRTAGFPIEDHEEQFGRKRWKLSASATTIELHFPFDEALALSLARRTVAGLDGTSLGESADRAFRKLHGSFDASVLRYLKQLEGALHLTRSGIHDYAERAETLDQLMLGLEDRRAVFIAYHSLRSTEPVTYDIHPYAIVKHGEALYVIGHSNEHQAVRTWKLDRVQEAEATQVTFERPRDFDPQAYLSGALGIWTGGDGSENVLRPHEVRIRFTGTAVRHVQEARWHPSQQQEPQSDGSLIVRFELADLTEVKSWILSYGSAAEALAPEELRTAIAEELQEMSARYAAETKT